MPGLSNYPPGVTGNEPQITGEDPFDERDYDPEGEQLYLVHRPCGESFDNLTVAYDHAHSGDCNNPTGMDLDDWSLAPEREAM